MLREDILCNSLLHMQIIQFLLSYQYHDAVTAAGHIVITTKFSMITPTFKNENSTGSSWNTILGYTAHKSSLNSMDFC